jgi:hypothetical protein
MMMMAGAEGGRAFLLRALLQFELIISGAAMLGAMTDK